MQKVKNCKVSVIFGSQNAKKYDIKDYLDEALDVPPKVLASLKHLYLLNHKKLDQVIIAHWKVETQL